MSMTLIEMGGTALVAACALLVGIAVWRFNPTQAEVEAGLHKGIDY
jgi:hypothetical protein